MTYKPRKQPFKLCCNVCDGVHADDGLDVYFGTICPNNCSFCIAKTSKFLNESIMPWNQKPDVNVLLQRVEEINQMKPVKHVQILGGEPLLFLRELDNFIVQLTSSIEEVMIQSSLPKCAIDNFDLLISALSEVDVLMISIHHPDPVKHAEILRSNEAHNRFESILKIHQALPKLNIQVNTVVTKDRFTEDDIEQLIRLCDKSGVSLLRLTEVKENPEQWVSLESLLHCKFQSPYSHGCKCLLDIDGINNVKVVASRNCFRDNPYCSASLSDVVKATYRMFEWQLFHKFIKDYSVGIFPDGKLYNLHKE